MPFFQNVRPWRSTALQVMKIAGMPAMTPALHGRHGSRLYSPMSIEFGWWNKDEEGRKYQVQVAVHGGNIQWKRHQGHHSPWEPHVPTDDDRARLIAEAERRVPRRLITQKQFEEIRQLSGNEGSGKLAGRRFRSSPER